MSALILGYISFFLLSGVLGIFLHPVIMLTLAVISLIAFLITNNWLNESQGSGGIGVGLFITVPAFFIMCGSILGTIVSLLLLI